MTGIFAGLALILAATGGRATTIGVAIASLAVVAAAPRPAKRVLAAVVIVTAALLGGGRASPRPTVAPPPWADGVEAVRGSAITAPLRTGLSQRFLVRTTEVETASGWTAASELLCVTTRPEATIGLGDRLWLAGGARRIDDIETRYRPVMRSRGCGASMFARRVAVDASGSGWRRTMAGLRDDQSGVLRRLAPGDAGALMSGLVTGDDEALSRGAQDAFVETGTTHITAVSGSNFTTLLVAFVVAGRVAGWRRRLLWLLVVVAAIWAYALFVGLNPPATRAAIVATGATLAVVAGRRPEIVTLIVLAAAAMVVVAPVLVWNLSFQLSLVASLAIAAVASVTVESTWRSWIAGAFLATFVAQLATLPILLPISGGFSLVSLPGNLAIGPLVALAFPLAAVAGLLGAVWLPLGAAVAVPARLACEAILAVVGWSAAQGTSVRFGHLPPRALLVVSLLAATICLAASRDAWRTWQRWPRIWSRMGERDRWLWGGAAAGFGLAFVAGLVG